MEIPEFLSRHIASSDSVDTRNIFAHVLSTVVCTELPAELRAPGYLPSGEFVGLLNDGKRGASVDVRAQAKSPWDVMPRKVIPLVVV